MSADCPDLYAPKTLRATMGGVFRLPVVVVEDLRGQILSLRDQGVQVYAAALHRDSVPITALDFHQPQCGGHRQRGQRTDRGDHRRLHKAHGHPDVGARRVAQRGGCGDGGDLGDV